MEMCCSEKKRLVISVHENLKKIFFTNQNHKHARKIKAKGKGGLFRPTLIYSINCKLSHRLVKAMLISLLIFILTFTTLKYYKPWEPKFSVDESTNNFLSMYVLLKLKCWCVCLCY